MLRVMLVFFGLMYLIFVGVLIIGETQYRCYELPEEKKSIVFIVAKSFMFPLWLTWAVIKESMENIG